MTTDQSIPVAAQPAGRLEAAIGKPAEQWSCDDLVALVAQRRIRLISLLHPGGDGLLKTLDFVPRSEAHLRDIFAGGERADGSSLFPQTGIQPGASDIILRPRLASAFIDPFSPVPTLALMCGHVGRDGSDLPESSETILRRAHARLQDEAGIELWAHGEVEYFLGRRPGEGTVFGVNDRGYHATSPFVFGEALRRQAMTILNDLGVPVKYGHAEVGFIEPQQMEGFLWEQHEIELSLAPLPLAADHIALTSWVLRKLADSGGMRCSIDPIVLEGHAGSGLHVHLSPVRSGRHLPIPIEDDELPPEARWLIGGLVRMGGALMAFGNCSADSFVRLIQGKEAPRTVTWGRFNRHALIRLPIQATTAEGRAISPATIEFRLADGSAQPYLLLAGIAQAMLLGRETNDLDKLLEQTRATHADTHAAAAARVPRDFITVGEEVEKFLPAFAAGGVFPEGLLHALLQRLLGAA